MQIANAEEAEDLARDGQAKPQPRRDGGGGNGGQGLRLWEAWEKRRGLFSLSLPRTSVSLVHPHRDPLPRGKVSFNIGAGLPGNYREGGKPGRSPARASVTCSVWSYSEAGSLVK